MYETPELESYGNFRELTKGGGQNAVDLITPDPDECTSPIPGVACVS
jgi:hypothetical protein